MSHHNFLPPCRISTMPTLSRHAGYFILFQTKMSGSVHIKFRNKSEYSMTHMLNPTLVKLNMYWLITTLTELKMNSSWSREHKRISWTKLLLLYLLFLDQYPRVLFFSRHSLKRIHFLLWWPSFFMSRKYSVHFLLSLQEGLHANLCLNR